MQGMAIASLKHSQFGAILLGNTMPASSKQLSNNWRSTLMCMNICIQKEATFLITLTGSLRVGIMNGVAMLPYKHGVMQRKL